MLSFDEWLATDDKPAVGIVVITSRRRRPRGTQINEAPGARKQLDSIWATERLKKFKVIGLREIRRPPSKRSPDQMIIFQRAIDAAGQASAVLICDDMTRLVKGMDAMDGAQSLFNLNKTVIGIFSAAHSCFSHEMTAEKLLVSVAFSSATSRRHSQSTSAGIAASDAAADRGTPDTAIAAHVRRTDVRARRAGPIIADVIDRHGGAERLPWTKVARELDALGVETANGSAWSGVQAKRVWERFQRISRPSADAASNPSLGDD